MREKALAAARTLETVLNSPQFADALTQRQDLLLTEGLSAPEILKVIRVGKPLQGLRDHPDDASAKPITLALSISPDTFEFSGYAGFTDLGTGIIYTKRVWFYRQSMCEQACQTAHALPVEPDSLDIKLKTAVDAVEIGKFTSESSD